MSDLIDRQAAIDAIRASTSKYTGFMEKEMYTDDDAVEAIEAVPAASPWHRVEEPPEEYGCYVVYRPYFPWTKAKYIWENGKNRWYSLNGEVLCPTHWMPIELPKEDTDGNK